MGSAARKRRAAEAPAQPDDDATPLEADDDGSAPLVRLPGGGVRARLRAGQRLLLAGRGRLAVEAGEVGVAGAVLGPGAAADVASDPAAGCLAVEATGGAAGRRVPLAAAGEAVLTLAPARRGGGAGFAVELEGAPGGRLRPPPPLPPGWLDAARGVAASVAAAPAGAPRAVVAVVGAKRVGKSAFGRLLANALLSAGGGAAAGGREAPGEEPAGVGWLDLDPGRPEFTPPGVLSLRLLRAPVTGPPHAHLAPPADLAAAHFVGDATPAGDPGRYLAAAAALAAEAARLGAGGGAGAAARGLPPPPLVVNTHGWVRGVGYDVLCGALRALGVTHLVAVASPNPRRGLPPGAFWAAAGDAAPPPLAWTLPPLGGGGGGGGGGAGADSDDEGGGGGEADARAAGAGAGGPSAVDARALLWTAFGRQCVEAMGGALPADGDEDDAAAVGDALAALRPLRAPLAALAVQPLAGALPAAELARALNGAVVALCEAPGEGAAAAAAAPGAPPLLAACLGLGVVRAVDAAAGAVFLLTPVAPPALARARLLQLGRLELPAALLQTPARRSPYLAPWCLPPAGTGAGAARARGNLARQGQQ